MITLALALGLAGFAALAVAMDKHHAQVFPGRVPTHGQRVACRTGGALLLLASAAACMRDHGIGVGLVLWCGVLTAAGLAVAGLLALRLRGGTRPSNHPPHRR